MITKKQTVYSFLYFFFASHDSDMRRRKTLSLVHVFTAVVYVIALQCMSLIISLQFYNPWSPMSYDNQRV